MKEHLFSEAYPMLVLAGFIAGILVGVWQGSADIDKWQKQAIERHLAQYNAATGEFEWAKNTKREDKGE